ncbi:MAG TPA: serine/threonine-protein kinase, partial [Burkholderiales bacterium]|nr:serine/threonine-protein kinase [Burkholderiales bacterium]
MSEPAYPDALPHEYRLHWYVVERVLGQGGFGITYLARDTNLDQQVAIKEYLPTDVATRKLDSTVRPRADDQTDRYRWGLDRFIREARTLARFDHPNIVRVYSVFEFNNTAYMVMRFEEGENFAALLERRRTLPEPELLRVILPVLDGLELIHNAGFIHRDIKPDNIHIRADGSPVLLDFGSARGALGQGRTVTILVAPGYAPFEQYYSSGESQGAWTDLYGLGATCYRAISGVPPLDAITRSKGVLGSSREVLVPARTIGAGRYSETVLRAIDHALEFSEKDRPQSIAEWRSELQQPATAASKTAAPAAPSPTRTVPAAAAPAQPTVPFARRLAVGVAFAGVAVAAGVIGAYLMQRSNTVTTAAPPPIALPAPQPEQAKNDEEDKRSLARIAAERLAAEKQAADNAEADRIAAEKKTQADREAAEKAAARQKAVAEKSKGREPLAKPAPVIATAPPVVKPEPEKVVAVAPEKPALSPPAGDGPAFTYYLGFAHRGNGEAMLKVAESYESGRGIAQNNVWACGWYERAGRLGVAGARARKDAISGKLQPRE